MKYKKYIQHETTGEFELDLAPLLAVMVKLVPVLLLSSAFVQMMIIETDLPQAVKDAIQQDQLKPEATVTLTMNSQQGFEIIVQDGGQTTTKAIPLNNQNFDYQNLHAALIEVKKVHPKVFKISLAPDANIEHGMIVKAMDEARKARDKQIGFPVYDEQQKKDVLTPYMFPEVVFANSLEAS